MYIRYVYQFLKRFSMENASFSIYCVLGSILDIAVISCCITIRFLSGAVACSFICTDCHGAFYFGKQTAETNRWDSQSLIWKSNVIKLSNYSWHKCHDLITYMGNSFGCRSMLVPPPSLACAEYFYYIENPRDLENSIWLLLLFVYQLKYFRPLLNFWTLLNLTIPA